MPESTVASADLSARELDILREFGRGGDSRAVADSLGITLEELERSVREIYDRLFSGALRCVVEPRSEAVEKERELAPV